MSAAVEAVLDRVTLRHGLVRRDDWAAIAERELPRYADPTALIGDPAAVDAAAARLVGHLTIGETYFLRHPAQLERVAAHLASRLDRGAEVRVWSAGCASGEEPYSVAIAVAEAAGAMTLDRVRIFATDLSEDAIARARAGIYGDWSFREAPPWLASGYFVPEGPRTWRLAHRGVRGAVMFEVGSAREALARVPTGSLDAVLFRNVGIYLVPAAREAIFAEIRRVLRPDGLLVVAPGDPRPSAPFVGSGDPATSAYVVRPEPAPNAVTAPLPPPRAVRPRPTDPPPAPIAAPPPPANTVLRRAREHADRGALDACLAELEPLGSDHVDALVLRGNALLAKQRAADAVVALRRATFLAPGHVLARWWYAVALDAAGEPEQALKQVRAATRALPGDDVRLEDGATPARDLRLALAQLEGRLS